MNKILLAVIASACLSSAYAEDDIDRLLATLPTNIVERQAAFEKLSVEQRKAIRERGKYIHLGGKVERPGSQKGKVVFINTTDIAEKHLKAVGDTFTQGFPIKIEYAKATAAKPRELMKSVGANVAIVIVENEDDPPMLVAPEEGWAVVNVTKLAQGLPDNALKSAMLNTRVRKELIRAFSIVSGGFGSPFKGSVINAARVEDLDACEEMVPYDTTLLYPKHLEGFGVTPREEVWYRNACKFGWAPAPTNDYQKAIWDKIHQLPSAPIKIEYNEKRDKGK